MLLSAAGNALRRMTIYSDFGSSFDSTKTGAENPVYKPREGAQPLYGHAVLIVGEFGWHIGTV
jgi:hypothetical protein